MLENNKELNFEQFVLDMLLESSQGAVKDFYLSLHPEEDPIEESEIEWMRKEYSKHKPSPATFTLIARGKYETSFFVHKFPSDTEIMMLLEYSMDNYMGYVDEFYSGDVDKAPRFSYGVIVTSRGMEDLKANGEKYKSHLERKK